MARQVSYLCSDSVHTLFSKSRVKVGTASLTLPASSRKVTTNDGTQTTSLMYLKKKIMAVRSVERGVQVISQPLKTYFSGKENFKKFVTSMWKHCALL